jgi:NAD(P)-dependent dehydrogenase (short-subunit alcohol dehydrogenase family)
MKKKLRNYHSAALITGAAGFMGIQHALALVELNLHLVLIDIDLNRLKKTKRKILNKFPDANILIFKCDICNEKGIVKIKKKLDKNKIFVKVLVNNAAIDPKMKSIGKGKSGSIEDYDIKNFRKEIDVNLIGAFICVKTFGKVMAERTEGSIINIASDAGLVAPDQSIYHPQENINKLKHFKPASYSISKHGLIGMTKYIATYWGHKKVRCNALAFGAVKKDQSKFLIKNITKRVPLGRLAKETEYRKAIMFLASEDSSYMTGQVLVLDGGRTTW